MASEMFGHGYPTPEEAAAAVGGGAALATVVSPDDEFAVVLLPVRAEDLELRGVPAELSGLIAERDDASPSRQLGLCVHHQDQWFYLGASIGNGLAWHSTSYRAWEADPFASMRETRVNLGVAAYAAPAPEDATEVVLRWRGSEHQARTSNGWFLFAAWNARETEEEPVVVAYITDDGLRHALPSERDA
jgi:hypothetical protein